VKIALFIIFITHNLFAANILVSNVNIKYKQHLNYDNLSIQTTNKKIRCTMFDMNKLLSNTYEARHYIIKNKPICNKDVKISFVKKIRYDFGNIVIQRDGEVIGETKKFIKVKNNDGTIYKIYKNGQSR